MQFREVNHVLTNHNKVQDMGENLKTTKLLLNRYCFQVGFLMSGWVFPGNMMLYYSIYISEFS